MFGAGAPLMGAGGQGFDPRRMAGGPAGGNTMGSNPFGRGSSGGADQFAMGGGPGGGPGGSAAGGGPGGGSPPWAQGPPGMGPGGAGPGGPAPPTGGQGMAGGNMGPGGSGGIFAGGQRPGGSTDWMQQHAGDMKGQGGGSFGSNLGGSLGTMPNGGGVDSLAQWQAAQGGGQLGMNVQGGPTGPKPMSPIGAGAYGQAGGNMLSNMNGVDQMGGPRLGQATIGPNNNIAQPGHIAQPGQTVAQPAGGPTGSMDNMRARLQAGGLDAATIDRRVQMAQQGKLPWQQAQGQGGQGQAVAQMFNSTNYPDNRDGGGGSTPNPPPSQGHPPGGLRQPPGQPAPPPTRGGNSGLNVLGSNPFGRGTSRPGGGAIDNGQNGGPANAGATDPGAQTRGGAAVRPMGPGKPGGGPAPPRGGIADGRPTQRPRPGGSGGISIGGGMSGGMKPGATGVSGGDFKDTRPAGVETKPQGTGGVVGPGQAKRQSVAGKAFGKLKA